MAAAAAAAEEVARQESHYPVSFTQLLFHGQKIGRTKAKHGWYYFYYFLLLLLLILLPSGCRPREKATRLDGKEGYKHDHQTRAHVLQKVEVVVFFNAEKRKDLANLYNYYYYDMSIHSLTEVYSSTAYTRTAS